MWMGYVPLFWYYPSPSSFLPRLIFIISLLLSSLQFLSDWQLSHEAMHNYAHTLILSIKYSAYNKKLNSSKVGLPLYKRSLAVDT